jgi:hypothetical protein
VDLYLQMVDMQLMGDALRILPRRRAIEAVAGEMAFLQTLAHAGQGARELPRTAALGVAWLYLVAAILLEVCGTTSMKLSRSFTVPGPTVAIFVFYGASVSA